MRVQKKSKRYVWHWDCESCNPAIGEVEGVKSVGGQPQKINETLISNKHFKGWGCSSVVEYLPNMLKAQGSSLITAKAVGWGEVIYKVTEKKVFKLSSP